MAELNPCRYCGASTEFRQYGKGKNASYQLLNPDGSLHECHERERSQAIPHIFGTEVDKACEPLSPEDVQGQLGCIRARAREEDFNALDAAIEVMKLVTRKVTRKEGGDAWRESLWRRV